MNKLNGEQYVMFHVFDFLLHLQIATFAKSNL